MLVCIARFGLAKTTLDDVAREAGLLAGHALPLLRRQARRSCAARGRRRARPHHRGRRSTAGRAEPTFADAVVARRRHRRARARAITTRCSSSSRTNRKRSSATSRSVPATASSSRSATRSRPRSTAGCPPTTRDRAGDWLARLVRSYVLDARTRRSTSPTPVAARAFLARARDPRLSNESRNHDDYRHSRSSVATTSTTSTRSSRSPTPTSTRSRTRCAPMPTPSSRGTTSAAVPRWRSSTRRRRRRSGTPTTSRGTSRSTRRRSRRDNQNQNGIGQRMDLVGHAVREVGRQGVDPVRRRVAELDAVAVHARRAGRADLHRADRRDRPVDRRQVLRRDAGDGRGPPRRGVRPLPRHEAVGSLPDQRAPQDAARRHHRRQPLGHDLPRHADHGRGPRARRVRVPAPDDDRAAAQAAAPLRHERRGPPRRVRCAVAAGVLQRPRRSRDPRAPGVRVRGRGPHARPLPPAGDVGAPGRRREGSREGDAERARPPDLPGDCCSRRSCRTARSSVSSTPATAGCASASPSSA